MKNFILWKVFLHSYNKKSHSFSRDNSGFTLIEALTSLLIGGIILGAAFGGFLSLRQLFLGDTVRVDINQRLRTVFGTIGPDIQQTGEGIISNPRFPAILVDQQTIGPITTSEITIRKADPIGFLVLCNEVSNNSDPVRVIYQPVPLPTPLPSGIPDPPPSACQLTDTDGDGVPDSIQQWEGKRLEQGGSIPAFIFDLTTGNGEFFNYVGENYFQNNTSITPSGSTPADEVRLNTNNYSWQNTYPAGSIIYLLEQRRYAVNNNTIQLIINENETLDLIEAIEKIDVTVNLQLSDGGTVYECNVIPPTSAGDCTPNYPNPTNYSWSQIKSIKVGVITQPPQNANSTITSNFNDDDRTLSQEFFPRNTLSF